MRLRNRFNPSQIIIVVAFLVLACIFCIGCLLTISVLFEANPEEQTLGVETDNHKADEIQDQPTENGSGSNEAQKPAYQVLRVIDGDTIEISYNGEKEKVRLIGIDTPEKNKDCYATEATNALKNLLDGKKVLVEFDSTQAQRDRYGRLLFYIWTAERKVFINQFMVEKGYAHEYTYNVPYKYQSEFMAAEKTAREGKIGLWGDACK